MRTIWNVISFLAVVNLLALSLFVGWLGSSDRLSVERLREVREIFEPTRAASAAEAKAEESIVELAAADQQRSAREADPALPAKSELNEARHVRQQEADSKRRIGETAASRLAELEQARKVLEAEIRAFETKKAAWEEDTKIARDNKTNVQFRKTVKQYETAPAANAKLWIQTLVASGERTQAVAYLDAMNAMASKKIFALFKTDDEIRLATELLERIRTLGQTQDPEDRSNANESALSAASPDLDP